MFTIISTKKLQEIRTNASKRVDEFMRNSDAAIAAKRKAEEELAVLKAKSAPTVYCSFCSKSQHDVKKLIAGPSSFICDECVELCMQIIIKQNIKARAAK